MRSRRTGYHLLLGASGFSAAEEEALVRAFLSRRVDAHLPDRRRRTRARRCACCTARGIPVVEGGNLTDDPIDMVVGYSNVDAAREVTRYLLRRGYDGPIGYIGAHPARQRPRARPAARLRGGAARRRGARSIASLCVETVARHRRRRAGDGRLLLDRRPDVRAVFCSADAIAVGALFECQRRGLAIPGRIAIAGFDDIADRRPDGARADDDARAALRDRPARRDDDLRAARRPAVRRRIVDIGYELVVARQRLSAVRRASDRIPARQRAVEHLRLEARLLLGDAVAQDEHLRDTAAGITTTPLSSATT